MTILKFHRWNAAFLCGFLALHFVTHLSGVFGVEAYNNTQNALRAIYRNPVIEPLVLGSIILQIIWGLMLLLRNVRRGLRGRWARIQAISGGIFLAFAAQHVIAMALARWVDGLDTNFYWPASVMSGAPFIWYFGPYYFLGVSALFVHLGCAIRLVLMRSKYRPYAQSAFWTLALIGLTMAIVINLTLAGAFYEIQLPDEWIAYLRGYVAGYTPG